jgi:von Willebrand factor type A domain
LVAVTIRNEQRGAAERLLDLVLSSGAHLWHNRPGIDQDGQWRPATARHRVPTGTPVPPGLFVPAAASLYGRLLDIYLLDAELAARFASYALTQTDWRDLQVCCAALMLVQPRAGAPVRDDDGAVAFHDDDYRAVGEAMLLHYVQGSTRMMTPKAVLRVAQLLEVPQIAELNRVAGFASAAGAKPPLGRWPSAARQWLAIRERNLPLLEGLVTAGYKETIKRLARKCGYRPQSPRFFEVLGWPQKQAAGGHRRVGLAGLSVARRERFDGLSEAEICERIVAERLSYKDAVGRLPAGLGLTPAIMVALLPSLSDRDLRILTPTLESLGLLADAEVRRRWERALATATDQRSLNVARNVRGEAVREALEGAAEAAVATAVSEAVADDEVQVMFLIDKSGSMQGAIDASKEALTRILAGFPAERLHIASFDTTGRVLRPKATSRVGVTHMLDPIKAGGGTVHAAALRALRQSGVHVPDPHRLIVIVVGDEDGERGDELARAFADCGYQPAALALIVNVARPTWRGSTVRDAAAALGVPFSEVEVAQFDDPYQVTRVIRTLLDAPVPTGGPRVAGWLDTVLATPLLTKP